MEAKPGTDLSVVLGEQEFHDPKNERTGSGGLAEENGVCAICLEKIVIQEMALVKGCEHAYCITCILRWVTYSKNPYCPQCKHPFNFLNVRRTLDGSINDYMFEESVCLLLRAAWFVPLTVETRATDHEEELHLSSYYYDELEDDDGIDYSYFTTGLSIRIGNRRWGNNGYVRAGRKEALPVSWRFDEDSDPGPSQQPKKKVASGNATTGRRAKRALKREAADTAAAAKPDQHQQRFGR